LSTEENKRTQKCHDFGDFLALATIKLARFAHAPRHDHFQEASLSREDNHDKGQYYDENPFDGYTALKSSERLLKSSEVRYSFPRLFAGH
jgi:hypothetical protein|tara:strand:+ start:1665 stop:1934 length:270 start_codon:yes stop_codon:yes gene_type:complete